jgi:hypothetical protein
MFSMLSQHRPRLVNQGKSLPIARLDEDEASRRLTPQALDDRATESGVCDLAQGK